ncbi:Phenylacetic acid catabolic protein [Ferviditalea candida]|uniref:Phenylacetic acid catabolic protein n=1 Tax=Ferviditalea candida TaxID=3108399 RepID=A0ABU5ZCC2_9BACL|nr:Phenylacetic acid catabolic protein [Paenibacillaceae bacterium T2]
MVEQSTGLKAFIELVEAIADNKFILGDRLVEIGIGGPDIEAATSAIAMAQGELGHSRILYNWIQDLKGRQGTKPEIKNQTGKAFNGVVQINGWLTLIAALYTVDVAQDLVLNSILQARREDVISRIHKLMKEQREHILYSRGWANSLLNDRMSVPRKFNEALDRIIPEVEKWLADLNASHVLKDEGYLSRELDLLKSFREQIGLMREKGGTVHAC